MHLHVLQINLVRPLRGKYLYVIFQTELTFFMCRNYLAAFKKVLALPVDLVSTAATTIASPFQRSSNINTSKQEKRESTVSVDSISTPPSTPKASTSIKRDSSSSTLSMDVTGQLEVAKQELDMLQNYLSLEISLQLIHINKESERRVQQFIDIGFPGRMKSDMYVNPYLFICYSYCFILY